MGTPLLTYKNYMHLIIHKLDLLPAMITRIINLF